MIELTIEGMRAIFPRAPSDILEAFVKKQHVLDLAGITTTRTRLAYFLGNVEHECGGFSLVGLTENIRYSAERMAAVWPNRFPGGANEVRRKYGSEPGWQAHAFDDIYGNRMGNRPGTKDGSTFIGRGGPQWTGRDGYEALARIMRKLVPGLAEVDLSAEAAINYAIDHAFQPEVCAAFWMWKNMNPKADAGDFRAVVKTWNGGYNGYADREALMRGNDPALSRLRNVERVLPVANTLPGEPPTPVPTPAVVDAATADVRETRKRMTQSGAAVAAAGGANEAGKGVATGTLQPSEPGPFFSGPIAWTAIGIGIALILIGVVLVKRREDAVVKNWF